MKTIKFNGCKHLDYGDNYVGCVKKQFRGMYVY